MIFYREGSILCLVTETKRGWSWVVRYNGITQELESFRVNNNDLLSYQFVCPD